MAKIKGDMGNTFDEIVLKSPLTVGRVGNEPGPDVNNNPVASPKDPLGLIPEGGPMPSWGGKK
jgi:hypothetical protein